MSGKRYKPNSQEIIYQLIDGEYILLNLSNGNYFSLDNLGVLVWECVTNSVPAEALISAIAESLTDTSDKITESVSSVFDSLLNEGLSIPADDETTFPAGFVSEVKSRISNGEVSLQPAKLHAYKNIQEKYAHPCGVKEI